MPPACRNPHDDDGPGSRGASGVVAAVLSRAQSLAREATHTRLGKIAEGDVEVQIAIDQRDELGQLARVFRGMVDYLQAMVSAAERIAEAT